MSGKRALVLLAPGFEEIEAVSVIDILRRAKVHVQIASVISKDYVTGSHNITLKSDVRLEFIDVKNDDYDLIYLPGGPGVTHLAESEEVLSLLRTYYEDKVLIGAICAAPWVLEVAGILAGHEITSFPTYEDKVHPEKYSHEVFVASGNILTSRGAGTSMEMGFSLLEALGLSEEAAKLREDMQYNFLLAKKGKTL